jgi:hypothetical protein
MQLDQVGSSGLGATSWGISERVIEGAILLILLLVIWVVWKLARFVIAALSQ